MLNQGQQRREEQRTNCLKLVPLAKMRQRTFHHDRSSIFYRADTSRLFSICKYWFLGFQRLVLRSVPATTTTTTTIWTRSSLRQGISLAICEITRCQFVWCFFHAAISSRWPFVLSVVAVVVYRFLVNWLSSCTWSSHRVPWCLSSKIVTSSTSLSTSTWVAAGRFWCLSLLTRSALVTLFITVNIRLSIYIFRLTWSLVIIGQWFTFTTTFTLTSIRPALTSGTSASTPGWLCIPLLIT